MIIVEAPNALEAVQRLAVVLYASRPAHDDDLLYESPGCLSVDAASGDRSPLLASREGFRGERRATLLSDPALWEDLLRVHYERLLIESAEVTRVTQFLRDYPRSKRATITVGARHPGPTGAGEPCLTYLWLRRRDGTLDMHAHYRGNDVMNKLLSNIDTLMAVQAHIAGELNLEAGVYRHISDSFHVYRADADRLVTLVRKTPSATTST